MKEEGRERGEGGTGAEGETQVSILLVYQGVFQSGSSRGIVWSLQVPEMRLKYLCGPWEALGF